MFRPITLLAIFIVSLTFSGQALADGKVFSKSATAKVNIPAYGPDGTPLRIDGKDTEDD